MNLNIFNVSQVTSEAWGSHVHAAIYSHFSPLFFILTSGSLLYFFSYILNMLLYHILGSDTSHFICHVLSIVNFKKKHNSRCLDGGKSFKQLHTRNVIIENNSKYFLNIFNHLFFPVNCHMLIIKLLT